MPRHAASQSYGDFYTSTDEYQRGIKETLIRFLHDDVLSDSLNEAYLGEIREKFDHELDIDTDLPSVLWQNGLLGFRGRNDPQSRAHFYSAGDMDNFNLPTGKEEYVLHPCLIETDGIRSQRPPLVPY